MDKLWIKNCTLENFGKIGSLRLDDLSGINLIIGENGTGKTFLLKALYSAIRTMEEYMRGGTDYHLRTAVETVGTPLRGVLNLFSLFFILFSLFFFAGTFVLLISRFCAPSAVALGTRPPFKGQSNRPPF